MSRFYLQMDGGKANSETLTRRGYQRAYATVAGWSGAVRSEPYDKDGRDFIRVTLIPWHASGGNRTVIYDGPLDARIAIQPAKEIAP